MRLTLIAMIFLLGLASSARAASTEPLAAPPGDAAPAAQAPPTVTATLRYNEGIAFTRAEQWALAETAYGEATKLKPDLAEAWNGLGHARKMQRKFPEALTAYQEALRLRPRFPQALEYLGETYVAMGKMDDARATLDKLKPLDPVLAAKLTEAIDSGKSARNW
jgi:Flp pilus assembly protein TadD